MNKAGDKAGGDKAGRQAGRQSRKLVTKAVTKAETTRETKQSYPPYILLLCVNKRYKQLLKHLNNLSFKSTIKWRRGDQ